MKIRIILFQFILALCISDSLLASDLTEKGKDIFTARCAACHKVGSDFTGPDLANVDKRRNLDWIINFVQSSQTLIKSGDETAVTLFNKFNSVPMPDHLDLKDADIKNIIEYIKVESLEAAKNTAPFKTPPVSEPGYTPLSTNNYYVIAAFLLFVALLVGALYFAVHVNTLKGSKENQGVTYIGGGSKAA